MAPKDGADPELRACTDSEPDSVELLDLDSDSGSQGWQAPLSYCDACDGYIGPDEASVEVGGRRWHPSCLTCWVCGLPPDQRCFVTRLGHVLCIDDFNRLYNTCRRCGRQFCSPWELAVVAPTVPPRRYHPSCFSCGLCRRTMVRHELFAVGTDDVFCPAHAPLGGAVPAVPLPVPPGQLGGQLGGQQGYVPPGRPGRGRRRGVRKTGARLPAELAESRRKRHRIQFSAQQLRELQTSFSGNPNPDSKSIFDLAGRLGLGKQHVQVWFQNRRAKERRLKSESPQSES